MRLVITRAATRDLAEIEAFIARDDIDDLYFDKPYYLTPSDRHGAEAFALIREGMKTLRQNSLARAAKGVSTIEQVLEHTPAD